MLRKIFYLLLRPFYPKLYGANPLSVIVTTFFPQKILGFNRLAPWPVYFTSRVLYVRNIEIGVRSFPGWSQGCYIQARNGIKIGNNLRMGPNVGLISADHDLNDYDKWSEKSPITIGDNVWIGMNSVILPGVTIGDNVVIGANSVVTKNIPSNSIAAGNPCRIIKEKSPYKGKEFGKND
jgi:acetyltransferase-like isoleucine patch superfamily enzyme